MVMSGRWFGSGRNRRKGRNKRNKRRAYKTPKEEKKTFHVRLSEGHKALHGTAEGAGGGQGGEIYCR